MDQLDTILVILSIILIAILTIKYLKVAEKFETEKDKTSAFIKGPNDKPIRRYIKNTSINNLFPVISNLDIGNNKYLNVFMHRGFGNYKPLGQHVIISYKKINTDDETYQKHLNDNMSLNTLRYKHGEITFSKIWDSKNMTTYTGSQFCIWRPNSLNDGVCLGDIIWTGTEEPPKDIITCVPKSEVNNINSNTNFWNYEGINLNSNIKNTQKVSRYNINKKMLTNIEERKMDKALVLNLSLV